MYVLERDAAILRFVASFDQATAKQVNAAVFNDARNMTPCRRALQRMLDANLLVQLEHRLVGGARGGSGQYVYMLGQQGMRLTGITGRYRPKAITYHTLAIVDAYVEFLRLHRAGYFTILNVNPEPHCWMKVGNVDLRADLGIDIQLSNLVQLKLLIEIDLGTEMAPQLRRKLADYVKAYNGSPVEEAFPGVLWLAPTIARAEQIQRLCTASGEPELFVCGTMTGVGAALQPLLARFF